jgi:hypothetical protein
MHRPRESLQSSSEEPVELYKYALMRRTCTGEEAYCPTGLPCAARAIWSMRSCATDPPPREPPHERNKRAFLQGPAGLRRCCGAGAALTPLGLRRCCTEWRAWPPSGGGLASKAPRWWHARATLGCRAGTGRGRTACCRRSSACVNCGEAVAGAPGDICGRGGVAAKSPKSSGIMAAAAAPRPHSACRRPRCLIANRYRSLVVTQQPRDRAEGRGAGGAT